MISEEGVIVLCILYIIGIGCCSYHLSKYKKKVNCFGKNKETNILSDLIFIKMAPMFL